MVLILATHQNLLGELKKIKRCLGFKSDIMISKSLRVGAINLYTHF